jgi:hypothetical protein
VRSDSPSCGPLASSVKHAEFNGAEKGLRVPEAKAKLHDFVGSKLVRHKFRLREFTEFEQGNPLGVRNNQHNIRRP